MTAHHSASSRPPKRRRTLLLIVALSAVLLATAALRVACLPFPRLPGRHLARQNGHYDYQGIIHFHTRYSGDAMGTYPRLAKIAEGQHMNFMIATEHNNLRALHDGKEGWYGKTLVLVGTELSRPEGYLLGLDMKRHDITRDDPTSKVLSDVVDRQGGFVIIDHTQKRKWLWRGPIDPRISGREILDLADQYLTASKSDLLLSIFCMPLNRTASQMVLYHPATEMLRTWDRETAKRAFVGTYGSDSHQALVLPHHRKYYIPFLGFVLPFAHDHLVMEHPLKRDFAVAKNAVYDAIRAGHLFVGVDCIGDSTGFFFQAEQGSAGAWMGDTLDAAPTRFVVTVPSTPNSTVTRIYHNGKLIKSGGGTRLEFTASKPGAYRAQVDMRIPTFWGGGRVVPWIYSNPIYLR